MALIIFVVRSQNTFGEWSVLEDFILFYFLNKCYGAYPEGTTQPKQNIFLKVVLRPLELVG